MSTSTSYPRCKAGWPSARWRNKGAAVSRLSSAVNYLAGAVMLSGLHGELDRSSK